MAALALAACASLQISEPYDARIEDGVNAYHRSFAAFSKSLQFAGRGPDARYDSETSREFYTGAAAELGNTILRARANNPGGSCPAAEAASLGLASLVSSLSGPDLPPELVQSQEEIEERAAALTAGSCTVVTLLVLKEVHDRFERTHRAQGFVSAAFAQGQGRNIEAAAEIALAAEQSKRP